MKIQTQILFPFTFLFGAMNYMYSPTNDDGASYGGMEPRLLPGRKPHVFADTTSGRVKGTKETSRVGRSFYQFRGIPYAEPPVGELRFEPPVPHEGWDGVLDATKFGSQCWQMSVVTRQTMGKEDCLFLNVYARRAYTRDDLPTSNEEAHPVMVFIHGGLFMFGGSNIYRPKYFLDEDVVLVTINYRLGSFGFLNTGDGLVGGNMGLKDQNLALRWIQENIHFFNGDPRRVTLMGESAGSISAHLHTMSPMSSGLFSGAISQSGTALAPWGLIPAPRTQAKELAEGLDCPTKDPARMVKCLKQLPGGKIARYHLGYMQAAAEGKYSLFGPTVEEDHGHGNRTKFLPAHPLELMERGRISITPWLSGFNSGEGLLYLIAILRNETMLKLLNSDWDQVAPNLLHYADHPDRDALSAKIKRYYLKDKPVSQRNAREAAEMLSDRQFFLDGHDAAILQARVAPTYTYYYTYQGLFALGNLLFSKSPLPLPNNLDYMVGTVENWVSSNVLRRRRRSRLGVGHSDELPLLFNVPFIRKEVDRNDVDYNFSRRLIRLWVSFAENGVPDTTSWPEGKEEAVPWQCLHETNPELKDVALRRLNLDERLRIMDEPFWERIQFWKNNSITYI